MTDALPLNPMRDPDRELAERCRTLGLPIWSWSGEGADEVVTSPSGWDGADAWLASPVLREMVESTRGESLVRAAPEAVELFGGCWLIPIVSTSAGGGIWRCMALALGYEALRADQFEAICAAVELRSSAARAAVIPIARHRRSEVDDLARIVRWMHADLVAAVDHSITVDQFSKQLVDSYEQMSMLYHVADAMSGLGDPHGFVRMACELLHNTLEFDWVAVRFSSMPSLGRSLANDLIISGRIPCSHTRYDRLAGELAKGEGIDEQPRILERGTHELPSLVESEVFANPLVCDSKLAGILLAGNKGGQDPDISTIEMQLISATSDYLSAFLHNSSLYNEQRTMFFGIVKALSASIDAKDPYTRGHSERVAHLAHHLTLAIGMEEEYADRVRLAGTLHDIGKIGVPEAVLLKPGRLTDEEYDAIKRHPTIGYNILKDIEPLQDVLPGVLYHHERLDGRGYPEGLAGNKIPLIGRILAVADAFDAMSSDRAYRPRIARDKVMREMRNGAGTQWDRELIRVFQTLDLTSYDAMIDIHAAQAKAA